MTPETILKEIERYNYHGRLCDPKVNNYGYVPNVQWLFNYSEVPYAHRAKQKLWTLRIFKEKDFNPSFSSDVPNLLVRITINTKDKSEWPDSRLVRDIYFDSKHAIKDVQLFTDDFFRRMGCKEKQLDVEDLILNSGIKSVATRDKKKSEESKKWKLLQIQAKKEKDHQKRLRDYESFAQKYGKAKDERTSNNQGE